MGKLLILYYSKTGNTEKMARQVAEGCSAVPGMKIRIKSVVEASREDIIWSDGLAVGSPVPIALREDGAVEQNSPANPFLPS